MHWKLKSNERYLEALGDLEQVFEVEELVVL